MQTPTPQTSQAPEPSDTSGAIKLCVDNLDVFYGSFQAIKNASLQVHDNHVTALIGPSGCGKST
ncbi:MAG TPA: ATP-binding cassette domain-containing protein, partial [Candidatus Baltobacteraceae bacterium]|nr:ATP-binding cassette domain-containing protein [Candidatus Baltobacteraceae bacterium]